MEQVPYERAVLAADLLGTVAVPSVLILGADAAMADSLADAGFKQVARVARIEDIDAGGLPGRYSLAIVEVNPVFTGDKIAVTRLLAALRDRFALKVLVYDDTEQLDLSDYLALGFERIAAESSLRSFVFDPDSESRQREWNNPRDWANPENFEKYRW